MISTRLVLALGVLLGFPLISPDRAAGAPTELLPGARRVLVLGDSITYAGQYVEFIDAYFVSRFPGRTVEFLDLGLPSETVSGLSEDGHAGGKFPRPDLHERLARVLTKTRPDTVIACYGMNDGIYLPLANDRFQRFRDGILWLRDRVAATGARLLLVTPPIFDEVKGGHPGYGQTLDRYAEWMLGQRAVGWDVVDLHEPMKRFLVDRRRTDASYSLAGDGVHPNETGHWIMAKQILVHLGAKDVSSIDSPQELVSPALLKLVQQRQRVLKDAWLTDAGHQRPGMSKGLPLEEAQLKAADLDRQIRVLAANSSPALPGPWQDQDIGAIEMKGSASFNQGIFTLQGTLDIWGTNDGYHFAWQKFTGDGQITARVLSVENTFNHAKAGLMFRQSLAADAKHAAACVTPVDGTQFLMRTETGGKTTSEKTGVDKGKLPYWVRLVRVGDKFSGFESADGLAWRPMGSTNIVMGSEILVGLVTSSHQKSILCTATLDNVEIKPGSDK